jgi:hypothetical protein
MPVATARYVEFVFSVLSSDGNKKFVSFDRTYTVPRAFIIPAENELIENP